METKAGIYCDPTTDCVHIGLENLNITSSEMYLEMNSYRNIGSHDTSGSPSGQAYGVRKMTFFFFFYIIKRKMWRLEWNANNDDYLISYFSLTNQNN